LSGDGGATFTPSNTGIVAAPTRCAAAVTRIRVDPSGSGVIAASTNNGLYSSADGGHTWTNIQGPVVPVAFTDVIWSLGDLYATTCGQGVVRTPFAQ